MAKKKQGPAIAPELLMLGYLCVKDVEDLKEKVVILDRFDIPDATIAQITGSNAQAVKDTRRSRNKPSKKPKVG